MFIQRSQDTYMTTVVIVDCTYNNNNRRATTAVNGKVILVYSVLIVTSVFKKISHSWRQARHFGYFLDDSFAVTTAPYCCTAVTRITTQVSSSTFIAHVRCWGPFRSTLFGLFYSPYLLLPASLYTGYSVLFLRLHPWSALTSSSYGSAKTHPPTHPPIYPPSHWDLCCFNLTGDSWYVRFGLLLVD